MKCIAMTAGLVLALGCAAIHAAEPEDAPRPNAPILSSEMSGGDLSYFTGTARQTALLVALSSLAQKHAITPEVQALAASVGKDQTAAAASLKDLAARKNVPLRAEPDGTGKKQLQGLAKLKGPKFDKTYLDALADAQEQLETSLQAGTSSADEQVKASAQAGMEVLKREREAVRKLGM